MNMSLRSRRFTLHLAVLTTAASLTLAPQAARAVTSAWILQDANGIWNNPDNWDNGVPKEPGDIALITNNVALSAARTITIDTAVSPSSDNLSSRRHTHAL